MGVSSEEAPVQHCLARTKRACFGGVGWSRMECPDPALYADIPYWSCLVRQLLWHVRYVVRCLHSSTLCGILALPPPPRRRRPRRRPRQPRRRLKLRPLPAARPPRMRAQRARVAAREMRRSVVGVFKDRDRDRAHVLSMLLPLGHR